MAITVKKSSKKNAFADEWVDDLVRVFWMGLGGRTTDLDRYLRRMLPKWQVSSPELGLRLQDLLAQSNPSASGLTRGAPAPATAEFAFPTPTGASDAGELLRFEHSVTLQIEPVWSPDVEAQLKAIVRERHAIVELARAGLRPTHTVILTGLPGVGKTLAAHWLARELKLPLAVLNLGAVMSSFLGRTGANLRQVIAYASQQPCVLLLDELDAIAKRRDDSSDIGELKRLVTVLLQELDAWPAEALLIAATNHEQLIDPAVWRRFERRIVFPLPRAVQQAQLLDRLLTTDWSKLSDVTRAAVACVGTRLSPADLTQLALRAKREVIVSDAKFEERLLANLGADVSSLPLAERRQLGAELKRMKFGQREINRLTGLARETIRELS